MWIWEWNTSNGRALKIEQNIAKKGTADTRVECQQRRFLNNYNKIT